MCTYSLFENEKKWNNNKNEIKLQTEKVLVLPQRLFEDLEIEEKETVRLIFLHKSVTNITTSALLKYRRSSFKWKDSFLILLLSSNLCSQSSQSYSCQHATKPTADTDTKRNRDDRQVKTYAAHHHRWIAGAITKTTLFSMGLALLPS